MRSRDDDRSEERPAGGERRDGAAQQVHAAAGTLIVQRQPCAPHVAQRLGPILGADDHRARMEWPAAARGAIARRRHQPDPPPEPGDEGIAAGLGQEQALVGPDLVQGGVAVQRSGNIVQARRLQAPGDGGPKCVVGPPQLRQVVHRERGEAFAGGRRQGVHLSSAPPWPRRRPDSADARAGHADAEDSGRTPRHSPRRPGRRWPAAPRRDRAGRCRAAGTS